MSNRIKLKRSSTVSKVPQISDLTLGELAINTFDGKLFFLKNNGSDSIESIVTTNSQITGSVELTGTVTANAFSGDGSGLTGIVGGSVVGTTDAQTLTNKTIDFDSNTIQNEPVVFALSCSDLTTDLATGTAVAYFRAPYAFTLTEVRASVLTASTGANIVVDINENGTSVLSTKLSIDISEKTSETAASSAVISDSSVADDAEITIDIDQVGSTVAGAGLIVYLIGTK